MINDYGSIDIISPFNCLTQQNKSAVSIRNDFWIELKNDITTIAKSQFTRNSSKRWTLMSMYSTFWIARILENRLRELISVANIFTQQQFYWIQNEIKTDFILFVDLLYLFSTTIKSNTWKNNQWQQKQVGISLAWETFNGWRYSHHRLLSAER